MDMPRPAPARPEPPESFFAHSKENQPEAEWQSLEEHLKGVARLAAGHAAAFDGAEWGRLAGLWHDLGKYSTPFQRYLRSSQDPHEAEVAGRIDHSTAGAKHAVDRLGLIGHLLAFVIAGHHSGLLDTQADGSCQAARLEKVIEPTSRAPLALLDQASPSLPSFLADAFARKDAFCVSFFTRMLYSALVDADFLDTEEFLAADRSAQREAWPEQILERMRSALTDHLSRLNAPASESVTRERRYVLESCLRAANRPPGVFSLTVPTGGGKTLSSLAFALSHAIEHDLHRVIYVVPFTSIIEQNAGVFRRVVAPLLAGGMPDPVVEHHSSLDPERETTAARLAAENWDAPLIVTTSVQFYESLFANRSSRTRKLHNMARAVIILDEVQAIPVEYLAPCLKALHELTANYGSTVVLCTATQPALERSAAFPIGLDVGRENEIIPRPERLYEALKRVDVSVEHDPISDEDLADRLLAEDQVLCIVNTRGHARGLAERIGLKDGHFHLSALMCPAHRTVELERILERLKERAPCRVVATRLVEAGVDVDFPVVYRSLAGLDAIAQAAGRCNRNGRAAVGRTVVFASEHRATERFMAATADAGRQTLAQHSDPLSLDAIEDYFRLYFWSQSHRWDAKNVLADFRLAKNRTAPFLFGFRRVARSFRLIEDRGKPIIVPWGEEGAALCRELRKPWAAPTISLLRRLQRYTVQVPESAWRRSLTTAIELVGDQYPVLAFPDRHYSERLGVTLPDGPGDLLMA